MKKFIAGMLAASVVLSTGVMAFAAESVTTEDVYYGSTNTVKTNTENYTTVMIKKIMDLDKTPVTVVNNSNVVYVNQQSSGFDDAVGFLLKAGTEKGYYQATFGNAAGESDSVCFVVGEATVDPDDAIADKVVEAVAYGTNNGVTYYKKGFAKRVSISEFNGYKSIKIVSGDGAEYLGAINIDYEGAAADGNSWEKTTLTGEGDIAVSLNVYGIPEDSKDLKVYFSNSEVNKKSE